MAVSLFSDATQTNASRHWYAGAIRMPSVLHRTARHLQKKKILNCFLLKQDMSMPTPTQELVTKDLHGSEWRFKHIYRGMLLNCLLNNLGATDQGGICAATSAAQFCNSFFSRPTPSAPSDYWMEHVCHIKEADCG
jgi:hypothetical protein